MGDITCWAPGSSCLAHSVPTACTVNSGDQFPTVRWMVAQEKPEDQDPSAEPSTPKWVIPALSCSLLAVPMATHLFCTPAPALLSVFGQTTGCKTELNLSVTCSPWPHLFLLLFPTAGDPWRWAVILTITVTKLQSSPWNYLPSRTHLLKQQTLATRAPPQSQAWHS